MFIFSSFCGQKSFIVIAIGIAIGIGIGIGIGIEGSPLLIILVIRSKARINIQKYLL